MIPGKLSYLGGKQVSEQIHHTSCDYWYKFPHELCINSSPSKSAQIEFLLSHYQHSEEAVQVFQKPTTAPRTESSAVVVDPHTTKPQSWLPTRVSKRSQNVSKLRILLSNFWSITPAELLLKHNFAKGQADVFFPQPKSSRIMMRSPTRSTQ